MVYEASLVGEADAVHPAIVRGGVGRRRSLIGTRRAQRVEPRRGGVGGGIRVERRVRIKRRGGIVVGEVGTEPITERPSPEERGLNEEHDRPAVMMTMTAHAVTEWRHGA